MPDRVSTCGSDFLSGLVRTDPTPMPDQHRMAGLALIGGPCTGLVSGRLVVPADLEAEDPSRVVDNQGADVDLGQTALTQAGYDVGEQMVVSETAVGVKPMLGGNVM